MMELSFPEIRTVVAAFTAGLFFAACACAQDNRSPLRLENEIALAGVEGRIDHFSVDAPGKRIFIAALGNGTVEVVDLAKGERTAEIRGLKEPQGLYYDDATSRLYVASAGDGTLRIYEGKDLNLRSTLEFGDDADNVRYDEKARQIWVGYGSGGLGNVAGGEKAGPASALAEGFRAALEARRPKSRSLRMGRSSGS